MGLPRVLAAPHPSPLGPIAASVELQPNDIASWSFEDTVVSGRVTIEKPSTRLLRAVAAAEASGDLKVKASKDERARMAGAVEPDSESLKRQQKAQADGSWHRGNHEAFVIRCDHELANTESPPSPERRAQLELGAEQSRAYLRTVTGG